MRIPLEQTFTTLPLTVPSANPVQIAPSFSLTNQVFAFALCNFSSNLNSIFWGSSGVTTASGIEITPGSAPLFTIEEIRQLYELETPIENILTVGICAKVDPVMIPLICWNPSNIWVISATASQNCSVALFNNVYS